jgi:hypothetical protein
MSYGCKGDMPHKFEVYAEDERVIAEQCNRCGMKKTYNKAEKGRVETKEYVKDHIRDFAQPNGRTGKLFEQLYGKPKDIKKKGTQADFKEV